jgi:hypothetical protein
MKIADVTKIVVDRRDYRLEPHVGPHP